MQTIVDFGTAKNISYHLYFVKQQLLDVLLIFLTLRHLYKIQQSLVLFRP